MTRVAKLFNIVEPESAAYLHRQNYEKIYNDVIGEVVSIVPIIKGHIVTPKSKGIGAEVGSIFSSRFASSTLDSSKITEF